MTSGWCDSGILHGQVRVFGHIVTPTCVIETGNQDQVVSLPTVSAGKLFFEHYSESKKFTIQFSKCLLTGQSAASNFKIKFDSDQFSGDTFRLGGNFGNIGLQILDSSGSIIIPGVPKTINPAKRNGDEAEYEARLQHQQGAMAVGSYAATVRYQLDYY